MFPLFLCVSALLRSFLVFDVFLLPLYSLFVLPLSASDNTTPSSVQLYLLGLLAWAQVASEMPGYCIVTQYGSASPPTAPVKPTPPRGTTRGDQCPPWGPPAASGLPSGNMSLNGVCFSSILEKGSLFFTSSLSAAAHLSQIVRGHAAFSAPGLMEEELDSERQGPGLFPGLNSQVVLVHLLDHPATMSGVTLCH